MTFWGRTCRVGCVRRVKHWLNIKASKINGRICIVDPHLFSFPGGAGSSSGEGEGLAPARCCGGQQLFCVWDVQTISVGQCSCLWGDVLETSETKNWNRPTLLCFSRSICSVNLLPARKPVVQRRLANPATGPPWHVAGMFPKLGCPQAQRWGQGPGFSNWEILVSISPSRLWTIWFWCFC